jgi:hypothetical protein
MGTPEGLPSLDEAFESAASTQDFTDTVEDDLFAPERPAEETPSPGNVEQAPQEGTAPAETAESVFGDLLEDEQTAPKPEDLWATEVELAGFDGPVKLAEVRDGYLRQSDYTRKTQALADERRAFAEEHKQALDLLNALTRDPAGTAAYLAAKTGVVDEAQVADKVRGLQDLWKPPPSREEIEAAVEKRVAEEVLKHPAVLQAQQQVLVAQIDADFQRIESKHGIKLSDRDRAAVLKRAIDSQTPDLDLVAEAMLAKAERVRQERDSARGAAGQRPSAHQATVGAPAKVESIEDAFNLALQVQKGG